MRIQIDNAIKSLAERIQPGISCDEAMRFSQAALNLAHARILMDRAVPLPAEPKKSADSSG